MMGKWMVVSITLALAIMFFNQNVFAEKNMSGNHKAGAGAISLPEDLKSLLTEEMKKVKKGMEIIFTAIVERDWDKVASEAKNISDSYILKQKMTKAQLGTLHKLLPHGLKKLDHEFHKQAGMLSHVAQARHLELVTFYYYKLTEGCVACHSVYATKRFPNYDDKKTGHDMHQKHMQGHKH